MSIVAAVADEAIVLLERFASKSTVLAQIEGLTVTAGGLEAGLGTVNGFISAFQAALKAKNYLTLSELTIEEAAAIAGDLGVPYAGLAAALLPFVFALINKGVTDIPNLVPDGRGGYVTKEWAANPRMQLNPDGSFKDGRLFP